MNTIATFITLTIAVPAFAGNTTINRKYGTLNPYFNQTSWGYLRQVKGGNETFNIPSIWMQDDLNKRMRIDVGTRGQPGFMAEFYFFKDITYELSPGPNGTFQCKKVPDFNYSTEIGTYGDPNFGFLGRHILQEYGGIIADVYVGQAIDGVGPMNCLFYCDAETCTKYLGLTVVGTANKFSFLEYWYGSNLTTAVPPASWFKLPTECSRPQVVEYYFDIHNLDGTLKQTVSSPSNFCSSDKNANIPLVLYRSLCCGLAEKILNN